MGKLKIKKGDSVKVTTGKYKGKTGSVLKVLPTNNKIIVEGVNIHKKHVKPSAANPNGGILEAEAPIHVSNVLFLDGETPTRIGRKLVDGEIKRFAKKTDKIIE